MCQVHARRPTPHNVPTRYKGCTITRTGKVCVIDGRRLYAVTGRLTKAADRRPWLTTQREAREWIAQQALDPKAYAPSARGGMRDFMGDE